MTRVPASRSARSCLRFALLVPGLLMCVLHRAPMRAEVSAGISASGTLRYVVTSRIVDPDPVLRRSWQVLRLDPVVEPLNPEGDLRGDGPPDLALHPGNGWPAFVWSGTDGTSHGIAFSEWAGSTWAPVEQLTSGPQDLDPRVFIEVDQTIHVTWWSEGPAARVWMISRPAGSSEWSLPVAVSSEGEAGRRPSVAVSGGSLYVAYERPSQQPGVSQEVVVSRRNPDGSFTAEVVAETQQTEGLDAVLHVGAGRFWVDWKQAAGEMAYAKWEPSGVWALPGTKPWSDESWIGAELVRQLIRWAVLKP